MTDQCKSPKAKRFRPLMWSTASAGLLVGLLSQPAYAQDQGVASAEEGVDGPVILVTARGREENIQDVPLAITAFDEEALERRAIQELDDVARFTPGFSFEDFSGGFANPVIRGQAQTRATALETNVSSFFDGIYIPRSWAVDIGTASIERIEIVKGPQSARYGRNAFAGAINYVPNKAQAGDTFGDLEATIGSDKRYDGGGFVNFAPSANTAIAASYNYSTFDGSWTNAHPFADLDIPGPSTKGNIGGWENESWSISGEADFDRFNAQVGYYRFDISQEARASRYFGDTVGGILDPANTSATETGLEPITNCGATRFGFFSPLVCGELPAPADTALVDPRAFGVQSDTQIVRVALTAELFDGLDLSYTFGNIDGDVTTGTSGEPDPINCGTLVGPAGGLPVLCNFQATPNGDINYDSHEVRLVYDDGGAIRGAVGGFVSNGRDESFFFSGNIAPITDPANYQPFNGTPVPSFNFATGPFNIVLSDEETFTDVKSLFGELFWTGADGALRVGAEARYTETEITAIDNRAGRELSDSYDTLDPRFTIEFDLNPDVMLYGTVARGSKAGGFNVSSRQEADRTFSQESNWTYEAGVKSELADGRLIFNGAVFYTDWNNIQINAADSDPANPSNPNVPSIIRNLEGAKVYGVELAFNFEATDFISIDGTFSHTDSTYKDGVFDSRFSRGAPGLTAPCDDIVCSTDGDISGLDLERQAPTQASLGVQFGGELGPDSDYFIRADGSWQSKFYTDSANLGIIPERFLLNATAGAGFGPFSVRLWARNLLDKKYVSNAFVVLLPFGNTYGEFYGERRTFGATVGFEF